MQIASYINEFIQQAHPLQLMNLTAAAAIGGVVVLVADKAIRAFVGRGHDLRVGESHLDYISAADHQSTVSALKGEIAELRSSAIALEVRMQALKQRQDNQLDALVQGQEYTGHTASFTSEDLVVLARQGWNAKDLARVGNLSTAEAELLSRLHGATEAS